MDSTATDLASRTSSAGVPRELLLFSVFSLFTGPALTHVFFFVPVAMRDSRFNRFFTEIMSSLHSSGCTVRRAIKAAKCGSILLEIQAVISDTTRVLLSSSPIPIWAAVLSEFIIATELNCSTISRGLE